MIYYQNNKYLYYFIKCGPVPFKIAPFLGQLSFDGGELPKKH